MSRGPTSIDEIIKKTLSGIKKAQKDYENWSGLWLWEAPEYMLTTYIAREICTIEGSYYLTLESNVKKTVKEAGGYAKGRPPKDARRGGRSDIMLWWSKGTPRAVIEVKNQLSNAEEIRKDIIRIKDMLNKENSFQCGLIAFYTSRQKKKGDSKGARAKIKEWLENIECGTQDILGEGYRLSRRNIPIRGDNDNAWVASVLCIRIR